MEAESVMLGWTTTATREDAERLARGLVEARLAACVQISGPLTSLYRWEEKVETTQEFRLAVKFAARRAPELARWLGEHHPYATPQWICCPATAGLEKYLMWVVDNSS